MDWLAYIFLLTCCIAIGVFVSIFAYEHRYSILLKFFRNKNLIVAAPVTFGINDRSISARIVQKLNFKGIETFNTVLADGALRFVLYLTINTPTTGYNSVTYRVQLGEKISEGTVSFDNLSEASLNKMAARVANGIAWSCCIHPIFSGYCKSLRKQKVNYQIPKFFLKPGN